MLHVQRCIHVDENVRDSAMSHCFTGSLGYFDPNLVSWVESTHLHLLGLGTSTLDV